MARRLLVTRPEPGASKTGERLRTLGFDPVILPLTEIVPYRPAPVDDAEFEAIAVSSANAFRYAPDDLTARLGRLPCHAVGSATASAARKAGFVDVLDAGGDGEALAAVLCRQLGAGARVAYLCGRVRTPALEQTLENCGIAVTAFETYDTRKVSYLTDAFSRTCGTVELDGVLVYSVAGADAVADLARRSGLAQYFESTTFFCLSKRIASVLSDKGMQEIKVSKAPTEAALFDLLRNTL